MTRKRRAAVAWTSGEIGRVRRKVPLFIGRAPTPRDTRERRILARLRNRKPIEG